MSCDRAATGLVGSAKDMEKSTLLQIGQVFFLGILSQDVTQSLSKMWLQGSRTGSLSSSLQIEQAWSSLLIQASVLATTGASPYWKKSVRDGRG